MATPTKHAICSASSSERWLHCTAAPRYEEQFPESTSEYAEEGRLAHSVCELYGKKHFTVMNNRKFAVELRKLKKEPLFQEEMLKTAEFYTQFLKEKAMEFPVTPYVTFEVQVDFSEYVPEGFGTCDNVMIGGDTLRITDYKHGKGVFVSSTNNSQMRLYALGALKYFQAIYGDSIQNVVMAIVQPRISEDVTEERMSVTELRAWGDTVKPKAMQAFTGMGATFESGEWCRFCRGKAVCRARADTNTAFEDFKDCVIEGKLSPEEKENTPDILRLSDNEVADLLIRAADLVAWYKDLQDYALQAILDGHTINGWKVVAGRSNRAFSDLDKALEAIKNSGYDEAMLYDRKPKTLSELEKMLGKKDFAAVVGGFVIKPMGKPTLVGTADPREPYNPAAADFAGVGANG